MKWVRYTTRKASRKTHTRLSFHGEGSILPGFFRHSYLPKPRFKVHTGKESGPHHGPYGLLHTGKGNESFLVLAFNFWKSMQNRRVPSFFLTRTMALHQGDFEGRMAPPSNMSCRFSRTSSKRGGAICRNLSLNGSSSISLIMCSAVSVQPISFLSRVQNSRPVPTATP